MVHQGVKTYFKSKYDYFSSCVCAKKKGEINDIPFFILIIEINF